MRLLEALDVLLYEFDEVKDQVLGDRQICAGPCAFFSPGGSCPVKCVKGVDGNGHRVVLVGMDKITDKENNTDGR